MAEKNLDWGNIGFAYRVTDQRYVSNYKNGAWDEGGLTADATVCISECAGILQYCQEVFEGLKAYRTEDGSIVTFRPDMNAKRMADSSRRWIWLSRQMRTGFRPMAAALLCICAPICSRAVR